MTTHQSSHYKGRYQIKVKGHLDKQWSDWFEGMNISTESGITILTGLIKDEAALDGILNRIRDLGIPLVSVNPMVSSSDEDTNQEKEEGS